MNKTKEQRLDICRHCKYMNKNKNICGFSGVSIDIMLIPESECPIKKWTVEHEDQTIDIINNK